VRTFLESREKLGELFREVDVAIMPSRTEGFGLVALEALSAGLPILVSANSGFGKALANVPFASGCVIKSDEPKEWAEGIKGVWAKNRKLRLKESDALRTGYKEEYSWEKQCNNLVDLVTAIVAEGYAETSGPNTTPKRIADPEAASASAEHLEPEPKRPKSTASTAGASAELTAEPKVKDGSPSDRDLQHLSQQLVGEEWKKLGRCLDVDKPKLTNFDKGEDELDEKALQMLSHWKQRDASAATYQVLSDALCDKLVNRKDLAERFCRGSS